MVIYFVKAIANDSMSYCMDEPPHTLHYPIFLRLIARQYLISFSSRATFTTMLELLFSIRSYVSIEIKEQMLKQ